jgi:hypothetical protein
MADPAVGSNPTSVTETQYGFAQQLAPFANNLLEDTSKLTDTSQNPYMQYQGPRQAQFTPLMKQSYESAALQAPAYQNQAATGLAGLAANKALGANYQGSNFQPGDFTAAGTAEQFMNPYQQNVTDIQKREAAHQADIAATKRGAGFAGAGAFGGSRQAIEDAEAQRNLGIHQNDIQAQGANQAYQQAMNQFNQQQQQQQAANQLNEQSAQFGVTSGLQGAQTALTGATTLGTLGTNQFNQETALTANQNALGTQQQNQIQTGLNNQYQDYLNAQNYDYKQLGFMSDMLRGLPLTANSSSIYQAAPSAVSQAAGLGTAALGAAQLMKVAGGGVITDRYADGGMTGQPMYAHAFDNGSGYARGGRVKGAGLADLAISKMA